MGRTLRPLPSIKNPLAHPRPGPVSLATRSRWHWSLAVAILLWTPRFAGPIDSRWDGAVHYILGTPR